MTGDANTAAHTTAKWVLLYLLRFPNEDGSTYKYYFFKIVT
jgi:hypothetical protein